MYLFDLIIIIFLLMFAVVGFKNGFFKQTVKTVGVILIFVFAFYFKDYVADFLSYTLPFIKFKGSIAGLSSLNIILYQLIAFLVLLGLFSIAFQILLKISGLIEKALNFTIILGIPSKLLGMVVGLIEGYVILFIILFVLNMTSFNSQLVSESSLRSKILTSSPVLSNVVKDATNTVTEIYDFVDVYVKDKDSDKFNYNAIDTMLKNKVITPEYVEKLVKKRKIDVKNIDFLIEKYKNKGDE